jgi:hypothetical protein
MRLEELEELVRGTGTYRLLGVTLYRKWSASVHNVRLPETHQFVDEEAEKILLLLWLVAQEGGHQSERLRSYIRKGIKRQCLKRKEKVRKSPRDSDSPVAYLEDLKN